MRYRPFPLKVLVIASAKMAEATSKVCHHCNTNDPFTGSGGCCNSCATNDGYLYHHLSPKRLKAVKEQYEFDAKSGFLRPDGCALPREKRSYVCLDYVCQKLIGAAVLTDTWEEFHTAQREERKRPVSKSEKVGFRESPKGRG